MKFTTPSPFPSQKARPLILYQRNSQPRVLLQTFYKTCGRTPNIGYLFIPIVPVESSCIPVKFAETCV